MLDILVCFNPCSVLLIKTLATPCSMLLLLLFDTASTPLARHRYFLLSTNVAPSLTLLLFLTRRYCSLFDVATLPSWHYYCSLFNVANVPYSTLLLFLLNITLLAWRNYSSCLTLLMFFIQHYCCFCSMLFSLFIVTALLAQHCYYFTCSSSCGLLRYLFVMIVMLLFLV